MAIKTRKRVKFQKLFMLLDKVFDLCVTINCKIKNYPIIVLGLLQTRQLPADVTDTRVLSV